MIKIRRITPNGQNVYFKNEIVIEEERKNGYWFAEIKEIGLCDMALTISGLAIALEEILEADYVTYALANDNNLTNDAKKIKQWFLENTFIKED